MALQRSLCKTELGHGQLRAWLCLPRLQLVVVDSIPISEDEEIVLLVALAGLVLHVPVVLPGYLVVIPLSQRKPTLEFKLKSRYLHKWTLPVQKDNLLVKRMFP